MIDVPKNEWREIDGLAVLRRILDDRNRIRTDVINDAMAEAAETSVRGILTRTDIAPDARATLTHIHTRLTKVLAARRRNRR